MRASISASIACSLTDFSGVRVQWVGVGMACRFSTILAMLTLAAMVAASAAETGAPGPVVRIGTTDKICQLTGDTDWESGRPTPGRTFANFGLDAADLGYPVEHSGKLILL